MDKWIQLNNILNENIDNPASSTIKDMVSKAAGMPVDGSNYIPKKFESRLSEVEKFINVDHLKHHALDFDVLKDFSSITKIKLPGYRQKAVTAIPMQIAEEMRSEQGLKVIESFVMNPRRHTDYKKFFTQAFYDPVIRIPLKNTKIVGLKSVELDKMKNELLLEQIGVKEQFVSNLVQKKYHEGDIKVFEFDTRQKMYRPSSLSSIYTKIDRGVSLYKRAPTKGLSSTTINVGNIRGTGGSGGHPPIFKIKLEVNTKTKSPTFNLLYSFFLHNNFKYFDGPGPTFNGYVDPGSYQFAANGGSFTDTSQDTVKYQILNPTTINVNL